VGFRYNNTGFVSRPAPFPQQKEKIVLTDAEVIFPAQKEYRALEQTEEE
jgi:hypothetical protein